MISTTNIIAFNTGMTKKCSCAWNACFWSELKIMNSWYFSASTERTQRGLPRPHNDRGGSQAVDGDERWLHPRPQGRFIATDDQINCDHDAIPRPISILSYCRFGGQLLSRFSKKISLPFLGGWGRRARNSRRAAGRGRRVRGHVAPAVHRRQQRQCRRGKGCQHEEGRVVFLMWTLRPSKLSLAKTEERTKMWLSLLSETVSENL